MPRTIVLAPEAVEDLRALRAYDRTAVVDGIKRHLQSDPRKTSRSRIKRLRGVRRPQYRLRIDDIRIFYDVSDGAVEILAIVAKADAEAWLGRNAIPEADPTGRA